MALCEAKANAALSLPKPSKVVSIVLCLSWSLFVVVHSLSGHDATTQQEHAIAELTELNTKVDQLRASHDETSHTLTLAMRAVNLSGALKSGNNIEYAHAIRNLLLLKGASKSTYRRGADPSDIALARLAVDIAEKAVPASSTQAASYMELLADVLPVEESIPIYRQVINMRTGAQTPGQEAAADTFSKLAYVLQAAGDHLAERDQLRTAIEDYESSVDIYRQVPGLSTVFCELAQTRLSSALERLGEYDRALQIHSEILRDRQARKESPAIIAWSMGMVAELDARLGRLPSAAAMYDSAIALTEASKEPKLLYCMWLTSASQIHYKLGNQDRALSLINQAAALAEEPLRFDTEKLVIARQLATTYANLEQPQNSLAWAERGLQLVERSDRLSSQAVLGELVAIAAVQHKAGNLQKAADLYRRAYEKQAAVFGEDSTRSIEYLSDYAIDSLASGDQNHGCQAIRRAMILHLGRVNDFVHAASDSSLRIYANVGTQILDAEIECAHSDSSVSNEELLNYEMAMRNIVTDDFRLVLRSVRANGSELAKSSLQRFLAASEALAAFEKSEQQKTASAYTSERNRLRSTLAECRMHLIDESPAFRSTALIQSPPQLAQMLPPHSALVEFIAYSALDAKLPQPFGGPNRYGAFIIQSDKPVLWVDLGLARPIREAVTLLRSSLPDGSNRELDVMLGRKVYSALLAPVVDKLSSGARSIYLVPYGALQNTPWAALMDQTGRYLIQQDLRFLPRHC